MRFYLDEQINKLKLSAGTMSKDLNRENSSIRPTNDEDINNKLEKTRRKLAAYKIQLWYRIQRARRQRHVNEIEKFIIFKISKHCISHSGEPTDYRVSL